MRTGDRKVNEERKRSGEVKNVAEKEKRREYANGLYRAWKYGSNATRLSFFVTGGGQILRGQTVKGLIYMAGQIVFLLFMATKGGKYLVELFSGKLGTIVSGERWNEELQIFEKIKGDNSFLILLYGIGSLLVCILFVLLWRMNVFGSYENDLRIKNGERVLTIKEDWRRLWNERFHIPLLTPPFLGLLVFTALPLLFMVLIAFTNYDYAHMPPGKLFHWVGLENFTTLFGASNGETGFLQVFLRVFAWTLVWAFFATFGNYFLGILLALLIQKKGIRGKGVWRTMFVIAIAVPQFVTLLLMQKILDGDGILNKLLGTQILWLSDQRNFSILPRCVILLVNLWIGVPYTLLMATGILTNIPADYYEAAKIDGASPVQIFFKITLPYMLQVTTPYLITQFVGNINNFNVIWLLTGGGPVDNVYYGGGTQAQSTDLLVTWLYRLTTDQNPRYNIASVLGILIFVLSGAFSLFTYRRTSAARNEEAFQ